MLGLQLNRVSKRGPWTWISTYRSVSKVYSVVLLTQELKEVAGYHRSFWKQNRIIIAELSKIYNCHGNSVCFITLKLPANKFLLLSDWTSVGEIITKVISRVYAGLWNEELTRQHGLSEGSQVWCLENYPCSWMSIGWLHAFIWDLNKRYHLSTRKDNYLLPTLVSYRGYGYHLHLAIACPLYSTLNYWTKIFHFTKWRYQLIITSAIWK